MRKVLALALVAAALCFTGLASAESPVLLGTAQTSFAPTTFYVPGYAGLIATQFTATATATTSTASFYFTEHPDTELVGIYSDNAGAPGTLLGAATMPAGNGWKATALAGVNLVQGAVYWLAELQSTNTGNPGNYYPGDGHLSGGTCLNPHPPALYVASFTSSLPASWPAGAVADNLCAHGFIVK